MLMYADDVWCWFTAMILWWCMVMVYDVVVRCWCMTMFDDYHVGRDVWRGRKMMIFMITYACGLLWLRLMCMLDVHVWLLCLLIIVDDGWWCWFVRTSVEYDDWWRWLAMVVGFEISMMLSDDDECWLCTMIMHTVRWLIMLIDAW